MQHVRSQVRDGIGASCLRRWARAERAPASRRQPAGARIAGSPPRARRGAALQQPSPATSSGASPGARARRRRPLTLRSSRVGQSARTALAQSAAGLHLQDGSGCVGPIVTPLRARWDGAARVEARFARSGVGGEEEGGSRRVNAMPGVQLRRLELSHNLLWVGADTPPPAAMRLRQADDAEGPLVPRVTGGAPQAAGFYCVLTYAFIFLTTSRQLDRLAELSRRAGYRAGGEDAHSGFDHFAGKGEVDGHAGSRHRCVHPGCSTVRGPRLMRETRRQLSCAVALAPLLRCPGSTATWPPSGRSTFAPRARCRGSSSHRASWSSTRRRPPC
eukprot:scaffold418_cov386-Prasinococcus_capsulatus_cf.AAC.14